MLLLLLACHARLPTDESADPWDSHSATTESDADADTDADTDADADGDTDTDTDTDPPQLVVLITQDAFTRYYYGWYPDPAITSYDDPDTTIAPYGWNTTPFTDELFTQGVLLPDVLMARALTGVSLATLLTGAYPRNHGIRDNEDEIIQLPTIQEQFRAAGWTTGAILSNRCVYSQEKYAPGWDHADCTYEDSMTEKAYPFECPEVEPDNDEDDFNEEQAQQCAEDLDLELFRQYIDAYSGGPFFLWVHLINPHDELETVEPWYSEFHPDPYEGGFRAQYRGSLDQVTLGLDGFDDDEDGEIDEAGEDPPYTDADRRYVDAVYASAVRANDARIQQMIEYLQEKGLYDDAVVVLGADHGDELNFRTGNPYYWHGCTYYNVAAATSWFFKAPGLAPGVLPGFQGSADIAPTILGLVDIEPDQMVLDGVSLERNLRELSDPGRAHFVERSARAAGVVEGRYKYMLNPDGGFYQCTPFSPTFQYTTPPVELFDLERDPLEEDNLLAREPDIASSLRATLCDYILADAWSEDDASNPLVRTCELDPGGS